MTALAEPLAPFAEIVRRGEPLARHTTLRIGGPAEYFVVPRSREQLVAAWRACRAEGMPVRMLGGGSNLLVDDDGVPGAVFHTALLKGAVWDGARVRVEPGFGLERLCREAAERGLAGMEGLVGIPGTLGGAISGNAGGRHAEIGSVVEEVEVLDLDGGERRFPRADCGFEYRRTKLAPFCIAAIVLRLRPGADPAALKETIRRIHEEKASTQPLAAHSAGCLFKNPPGQSAGRLIDEAGFKMQRVGGAMISDRHANFVLNVKQATGADVSALARQIQNKVQRRTGILLEPEIRRWPGGWA
ncbi:MAG: UDP-N-acetylmuramate dehydrogenase [Planctomycetes bacterium]|nr:UDP-N-acetylmuramate dehydrogenase [Planctomycetota bacterium]